MQKYDALHLKNCGLSNKSICNILGICNNTLLSFFKQYTEGGLDRLNEINFYKPQSDLKQYSGSIENYFKENPPQSISEAAAKIEELTGIKRGETQVRKFMKDKGFRCRKIGNVPAKALTEEKKTSNVNFWSKSQSLVWKRRKPANGLFILPTPFILYTAHLLPVCGVRQEFLCRAVGT